MCLYYYNKLYLSISVDLTLVSLQCVISENIYTFPKGDHNIIIIIGNFKRRILGVGGLKTDIFRGDEGGERGAMWSKKIY